MPRILVAECIQEVSSFNPFPGRLTDMDCGVGHTWLDSKRGVNDEVDGAIDFFESADGVTIVPGMGAKCITSSGVIAAEDWDTLSQQWLNAVSDAGDVDGVYFALHGAMAADNELDPEGFLLQEARKILGEEIPIVTSLDLHGILTDRMIQHNDAIVLYHTYPHVDHKSTAQRACSILLRRLAGEINPVMARVKIPALVRGDELITESGSFGECIRLAKQIEESDEGLAAGMLIGNPFTDVPELRTNSLVVMDGDAELASSYAREMAELFWHHHEKMRVPLKPLAESVQMAKDVEGTVILKDAADATSSGASGDSNAILAELLSQGYQGSALIPIVDPAAVTSAFESGIGSTIDVTLGGQLDKERYTPVSVSATVHMLTDGQFESETFRLPWNAGRTAVLTFENYTVIATSRAVSLFDRSLFYAHGQDPKRFDAVVVKSPHCEPHMFADWAGLVIDVDAPGSTSADVRQLGHTICARPVWPLDEISSYGPVVEHFGRGG